MINSFCSIRVLWLGNEKRLQEELSTSKKRVEELTGEVEWLVGQLLSHWLYR